mmetsp:Transcript_31655/g.43425  ORF Transcript_31655/g.43425 Transcript_31655/m.43425 type:complete len:1298 (-) Transcript_31655:171-4064(-)
MRSELIYLKDEEFLPNNLQILANTQVLFINANEDSHQDAKINLVCEGLFSISLNPSVSSTAFYRSNLNQNPNEAGFTFVIPGKYQIYNPNHTNMKCLIEVIDSGPDKPPKYYFPTTANKNSNLINHPVTTSIPQPPSKLSIQASSSHNSPILKPSTPPIAAINFYGKKKAGHAVYNNSSSEYSSADEKKNVANERRFLKSIKRNKKSNQSNLNQNNINSDHKSKSILRTKHIGGQVTSQSISSSTTIQSSPVISTSMLPPILVEIEDYEFSHSELTVHTHQSIHFQLSKNVPLHAEHILVGSSEVKALRFESPLLQQHEETSFSFTPCNDGEMIVSCKIYPEMICRVTVVIGKKGVEFKKRISDENSLPTVSSALKALHGFDVTVDADIRIGGGIITNEMLLSNHGDYLSESQSFVDSDDVFSCSDSQNQQLIEFMQQKHKHSPVTPFADGHSPSSFSKTDKFSDENQPVDERFIGNHSPQCNDNHNFLSRNRQRSIAKSTDFKMDYSYSSDDDEVYHNHDLWSTKRDGVSLERLPRSIKMETYSNTIANHSVAKASKKVESVHSKRDHIILVEEFSFRPANLTVFCGETVTFRKSSAEILSNMSLSFSSEFETFTIQDTLQHTFLKPGVYDVINDIYSFMQCRVTVLARTEISNKKFGNVSPLSADNFIRSSGNGEHGVPHLIGSFPPPPIVGASILNNETPSSSPTSTTSHTLLGSIAAVDKSKQLSFAITPKQLSEPKQSSPSHDITNESTEKKVAPLYGSFASAPSIPSTIHNGVSGDFLGAVDDEVVLFCDTDSSGEDADYATSSQLSRKKKKQLKSRQKKKSKKKGTELCQNVSNAGVDDDGGNQNQEPIATKKKKKKKELKQPQVETAESTIQVEKNVSLQAENDIDMTASPDLKYAMLTAAADWIDEFNSDSDPEIENKSIVNDSTNASESILCEVALQSVDSTLVKELVEVEQSEEIKDIIPDVHAMPLSQEVPLASVAIDSNFLSATNDDKEIQVHVKKSKRHRKKKAVHLLSNQNIASEFMTMVVNENYEIHANEIGTEIKEIVNEVETKIEESIVTINVSGAESVNDKKEDEIGSPIDSFVNHNEVDPSVHSQEPLNSHQEVEPTKDCKVSLNSYQEVETTIFSNINTNFVISSSGTKILKNALLGLRSPTNNRYLPMTSDSSQSDSLNVTAIVSTPLIDYSNDDNEQQIPTVPLIQGDEVETVYSIQYIEDLKRRIDEIEGFFLSRWNEIQFKLENGGKDTLPGRPTPVSIVTIAPPPMNEVGVEVIETDHRERRRPYRNRRRR